MTRKCHTYILSIYQIDLTSLGRLSLKLPKSGYCGEMRYGVILQHERWRAESGYQGLTRGRGLMPAWQTTSRNSFSKITFLIKL